MSSCVHQWPAVWGTGRTSGVPPSQAVTGALSSGLQTSFPSEKCCFEAGWLPRTPVHLHRCTGTFGGWWEILHPGCVQDFPRRCQLLSRGRNRKPDSLYRRGGQEGVHNGWLARQLSLWIWTPCRLCSQTLSTEATAAAGLHPAQVSSTWNNTYDLTQLMKGVILFAIFCLLLHRHGQFSHHVRELLEQDGGFEECAIACKKGFSRSNVRYQPV